MKKLALAICLLVVSIAAQAQFEKGKMILNPSVTGLDFSYSKNDKAKLVLVRKPVHSLPTVSH